MREMANFIFAGRRRTQHPRDEIDCLPNAEFGITILSILTSVAIRAIAALDPIMWCEREGAVSLNTVECP
jgi:hypothetical protein